MAIRKKVRFMKKKSLIIVGAIVAIVLLVLIWGVSSYNGLVNAEVNVEKTFADIDVQLTRRAELIPNLVNTVKGYAAHEEEVFTAIADARAKLSGSTNINDKIEANNELSSALSRLLVIVEQYPDLKASKQFTGLMDQLEGTENRIAVARGDYNEAVTQFNTKIRRFPGNLIAGMFGFEKQTMYEAPAENLTAPDVIFD